MTSSKAVLVLASLLAVATARETTYGSSTYNATVNGGPAASADVVNPLYLTLDVSGEVSGTMEVSIQYDNTQQIAGGDWTFNAGGYGPDGSPSTVGTLTGTFASSGSIELNADGSAAAVKGASLVIESGTGTYEAVASGSGSLDGTLAGAPTPAFSGTLTVTF